MFQIFSQLSDKYPLRHKPRASTILKCILGFRVDKVELNTSVCQSQVAELKIE